MPGQSCVGAAGTENRAQHFNTDKGLFVKQGPELENGQRGVLLLEVSNYSGDVLILATGTVSRSALDHGECGFYIQRFLLIFCSSSSFSLHFLNRSHTLLPPLFVVSLSHARACTLAVEPSDSPVDIHTV